MDGKIYDKLRMKDIQKYLHVYLEIALHLRDGKPCHEAAIYTSNDQVP